MSTLQMLKEEGKAEGRVEGTTLQSLKALFGLERVNFNNNRAYLEKGVNYNFEILYKIDNKRLMDFELALDT